MVEATRPAYVVALAERMGPGAWVRSARPEQAWLLRAVDEHEADAADYSEVRARLSRAGGLWDSPPERLREA